MKELCPPPLEVKDKAQLAIERLLFRGQQRFVSESTNLENKTRTRRREWVRLRERRRIISQALANALKQTSQTSKSEEMPRLFAILPICFLELQHDTSLLRSIINSIWSTMLAGGKIDEGLKVAYGHTVSKVNIFS